MAPPLKNIVGQRFGKLLVLEFVGSNHEKRRIFKCRCDCGNETTSTFSNLVRKNKSSCGCGMRTSGWNIKHGASVNGKLPRIYRIWQGMKARCYRIDEDHYPRHGGRGITVCDEWRDNFKAFEEWSLKNGYADNLTIDRFPDNNGPYSPSNCRWATMVQQNRNKRSNVFIEAFGKKLTLAEWAEVTGLPLPVISRRRKKGWSDIDVITKPLRITSRSKKG
jgi:hypothetical protein